MTQVAWFEEIAPESAAGILAYLSNGCAYSWRRDRASSTDSLRALRSVIKGVGESIASKMVAAFGERTLEARSLLPIVNCSLPLYLCLS